MRKLFLEHKALQESHRILEEAVEALEERIEALEIKSNRKPGRPPKPKDEELNA